MKNKIFLTVFIFITLCVVVLLMFLFVRGGYLSVTKLSFHATSGALPPDYYWESDLNLTPDFTVRTFSIKYVKNFPYKKPAPETTVPAEGTVGGEFFDRLENILTITKNYKALENPQPLVGAGVLTISIETRDGKKNEYQFTPALTPQSYDTVNSFYADVTSLFIEDVL